MHRGKTSLGRTAPAHRGDTARAAGPAAAARALAACAEHLVEPAADQLCVDDGGAGHLLGGEPAIAGVRLALPVRPHHGAAGCAAPGVQLSHRLELCHASCTERSPGGRTPRPNHRGCRRSGRCGWPAPRAQRSGTPRGALAVHTWRGRCRRPDGSEPTRRRQYRRVNAAEFNMPMA